MSKTTDTGTTLGIVGKMESAGEVELAERSKAREAYQLRQGGMTMFEIAETLGMSEGRAKTLISEVATDIANLIDLGEKEQILTLELSRLDSMMASVWPGARSGDFRSIETVLRIMSHRAKLLGLEEATVDNRKQTVVIAGDTDSYMAAIDKAMGNR